MPPPAYYFAIPFNPDAEGNLSAGEAKQCRVRTLHFTKPMRYQLRTAAILQSSAVVSRTLANSRMPVILGKFGKTPDDLSEL